MPPKLGVPLHGQAGGPRTRHPRNRSANALARAATRAKARAAREEEKRAAKARWEKEVAEKHPELTAVFSQRLSEAVGDSPGAFESLTGVPHGTLQGWLQHGKPYAALPTLDRLRVVAERADISLDWLAGFDVPRRRSDREPVGELAQALVAHVHLHYLERRGQSHLYVDGIARVLHGEPMWGPEGLRVVKVDDPRPFLADVETWAFEAAEAIERRSASIARERLLDAMRKLESRLHALTEAYRDGGAAERDARATLLGAALAPDLNLARGVVRELSAKMDEIERRQAHNRAQGDRTEL